MKHIDTNLLVGGPKDGERVGSSKELGKYDSFGGSRVFYVLPKPPKPVLVDEGKPLPKDTTIEAEQVSYLPLRIQADRDTTYWIYASVEEFGVWIKPAEVFKKLLEGYHPTLFEEV